MTADSEGRKRPRMSLARRGAIALGLSVSTWPAGALARSDYRWTSGLQGLREKDWSPGRR
jgi:hypothetical protein